MIVDLKKSMMMALPQVNHRRICQLVLVVVDTHTHNRTQSMQVISVVC